MNEISYTHTSEDWGDFLEWNFDKVSKENRKKLKWIEIALMCLPVFLFLLFSTGLRTYAFFAAFCLFLGNIVYESSTYESSKKRLLRKYTNRSAVDSSVHSVSLQARGVMEITEVEESLTLWDAITEVQWTEKFLYAKDKRDGILLVPVRAFGSESAMKAFALEIENRRMRHAVGLTPAVQTAQVIPVPTQEAPQQQVTAGWWRKSRD